MNIIQKDNIQFYFGLIEFKGEGIVKQRKGKAGTRKGKHVWAGKKIPAVVVGFCGVCNIPIREENEELLRFLKVPEIFEYVLTGVFEALAKRPSQ